jgi:hypothetical protein
MDVLFLFVLCGATAAVSVVVYAPRPRRVCDGIYGADVPTGFRASNYGAGPLADSDNFG